MAKPSKSWQPKTERIRFSRRQAIEIYRIHRDVFSKDQPLPKIEEISRDGLNRLDGCLGSIRQQTKGGKYLYKSGIDTAAAYFYFVNKSHWLINGNKRSAIIFALEYLKAHNKWIKMSWREIYKLAKETAIYEGEPKRKLKEIGNILQQALIDYEEGVLDEFVASWEEWRAV